MITAQYKEQCRLLHRQQTWGNHGWKSLPHIMSLILEYKTKLPTILDYGSGEGTFETTARWALPHAMVRSYDPGMPGYDTLPVNDIWHFTTCTDVLEHIEPQFLSVTLDHIRALTRHAAYFIIACSKAKAILPDGRNAHLIVKPPEWWIAQLASRWRDVERLPGKGLTVITRA